ncbi:hypothetical protein GW830_03075 [bacterium]|nr:hypothetical protein [bacterium]
MGIKKDVDEEKIYENKKKGFDRQIEILTKEIALFVTEERNEVLELEAFINLLNDAGSLYAKASYVQKGKIAKLLFSNMVLDNQKRLHIAVKP